MAKTNTSVKTPKRAKSTKPKASFLSEERIVNSDSESETPKLSAKAPLSNGMPLKKAKKPDSGSASKAKAKAAEPTPDLTPARKAKKASAKPLASTAQAPTGSTDESESSFESSDGESAVDPRKSNGLKRKTRDGDSEKKNEDREKLPQAKRAKTTAVVSDPVHSADEDSDSENSEEEDAAVEEKSDAETSDDEEASSSETGEIEDVTKVKQLSAAPAHPSEPATSSQASTRTIPAEPFRPPAGYTSAPKFSSRSTSLLAADSINGQQIWHIIAPSSVPLSSLTQMTMDAIKTEAPVLTHQGIEYVFKLDKSDSANSEHIMIPGKNGYEFLPQKIHSTLSLQQKIVLPNLSQRQSDLNTGSSAAANIAQAPLSVIRPQPKGLRMRYKPSGFGSGDPGRVGSGSDSGDDNDMDTTAKSTRSKSLQFPKALGAHTVEQTDGTRETSRSAKVKKSKKAGKERLGATGDDDVVADREAISSARAPSSLLEGPKDTVHKSGANVSNEERKLSKEEKAKRKELKRQKKEAKLKAAV